VRHDGRKPDAWRPVTFQRRFTGTPAGSVLASCGRTRVLCTASLEDGVPPFLANTGRGWITAEYDMLPGSTAPRKRRDPARGRDGRSVEIQRMVGRILRSVAKLDLLGERTICLDCHVLEADGGTRITAVNGSYVALVDALTVLQKRLGLEGWWPLRSGVAAASVGLVAGEPALDLDYKEDASADADMNVAMSHKGEYLEVQGTGERRPIAPDELHELLDLAARGTRRMAELQKEALET
jgi:ribonuclease PH